MKKKQKILTFKECLNLYLIKTQLNFTSNFVDQNDPKSRY